MGQVSLEKTGQKAYDVVVVGAGAAGLMAALTAAEGGMEVLLLDGQKKIGAKILMSGGTRCNVTNQAVGIRDYNSAQPVAVRNILAGFTNTRTLQFFHQLGVELVLEPTGKYFPSTHSGKTVLDALVRRVQTTGVVLKTEHKVRAVRYGQGGFSVSGEGFHYAAHSVVLTTGGLSYPSTGSDGGGYAIAQSFGHRMVATAPALTPLTATDEDFKLLAGISLDVQLTLFSGTQKCFSSRDGFLFTHFGFSGPAVLDISRHWLKAKGQRRIHINFFPGEHEQSLLEHFQRTQAASARKTIKSFLAERLPERLAEVILKKTGILATTLVAQLSRASRLRLAQACTNYPLAVKGVVGYSKAEVTAGGVDLAQVHPKTLESMLQPGLFFAGEILDVDGRIGGFNFQWAWASGHATGEAVRKLTNRS